MRTNNKKGISLIVLVLTIIIMIILATAIILSLSNSGIIGRSSEAKLKSDISTMQEELEVLKANSTLEGSNEEISINDLSSAKSYKEKFAIQDDELKFVRAKLTEEEVTWAEEAGLKPYATVLVNGENGVSITDGKLFVNNDEFNLTDVIVPEGVTSIGELVGDQSVGYFASTSLVSIVLPHSLEYVVAGAFGNCPSLTNVEILSNHVEFGNDAFDGCKSLVNISFPTDFSCDYWDYLFAGCLSLESITIPAGVAYISSFTFSNCTSLKNITIEGAARFNSDDIRNWFALDESSDISDITITGSGYISGE